MQLLALMQGSVFVTIHMIFGRKVIASLGSQHTSTSITFLHVEVTFDDVCSIYIEAQNLTQCWINCENYM